MQVLLRLTFLSAEPTLSTLEALLNDDIKVPHAKEGQRKRERRERKERQKSEQGKKCTETERERQRETKREKETEKETERGHRRITPHTQFLSRLLSTLITSLSDDCIGKRHYTKYTAVVINMHDLAYQMDICATHKAMMTNKPSVKSDNLPGQLLSFAGFSFWNDD